MSRTQKLLFMTMLMGVPCLARAEPAWSPSACGHEPAVPAIETGSIAVYNASIDATRAYDAAARRYVACVDREATAEQRATSLHAGERIDQVQSVRVLVQQRIAANFATLAAALKHTPQH